jgi:hypothetical protein
MTFRDGLIARNERFFDASPFHKKNKIADSLSDRKFN